jgi:hypothetical protein
MMGLDLLAAHMVGDFILQTNRMARLKYRDTSVRFVHCTIYALLMLIAAWSHAETGWGLGWFVFWIWLSHYVIDAKKWASDHEWPVKSIMVDQTLHIVVLAFAARLL